MKKLIEHKKTVLIPIYGYAVHVIITNDVTRSITKWYTKRDQKLNDPTGTAFHLYQEGLADSTLILPRRSDIGVVVHECWHAVNRVFEWVNIPIENETVAYTLEYLCREVGLIVLTS